MSQYKTDLKRIIFIMLGTLLSAISTNGILVQNKLLSGGVSGISMLFHFLFGWNISTTILCLNIPLFILGFFFLKKKFLAYSLFGMMMLSFWIEVTKGIVIPTESPISIILVGGFLSGIGNGIIFRGDGSTGGTDIISKIVNKYFSFSMATVNLAMNGVIIFCSLFFFGLDLAVLTIATMFISSKVINFVVDGVNYKRTLFIITDEMHYETIASDIMQELHRGVTVIPATGGYTHHPRFILYTTIGIREVAKVKQIAVSHDPHAFMTVSETAQVIGRGRGFISAQLD
ncbi:MAG: YitT family protein [Cellulosilyticaceae bacterium]